ncbi:MAG: hypothetical protein NTU59_02155 [Coprothermobacterota bacterium]|nr:hypothetical protein [Coprothermobacterota bacterium]
MAAKDKITIHPYGVGWKPEKPQDEPTEEFNFLQPKVREGEKPTGQSSPLGEEPIIEDFTGRHGKKWAFIIGGNKLPTPENLKKKKKELDK